MATGNGGLHFEPTMDVNGIKKSAQEVKKEITDTTKAVEAMGTAFDLMTDITKQDINDQKQYIKGLEAEYAKLEKRVKSMPKGAAKSQIQGQMSSIRHEIESEEEALNAMEQAVQKNSKAHLSYRTQLRQVNQEMMELAANGQRDTEAYAKLQAKAIELKQNMRTLGKELQVLSSPGTGFQAVASGMSAATGVMAALNGAIGLFGDKSENLNEIMQRTQSLMAITIGLQQVSITVSKQGAVMIGIEAVQRAAAAKAAQMQARGTMMATAAQKAFNVVAKANPYVLLATAILTVVGAIAAFALGAKEATEEEKRLNAEMEKSRQIEANFNRTVQEGAAKLIASYKSLQIQWQRLSQTSEKTKWLDENKTKFNELGLAVNSVDDAEKVLVQNTDSIIKAFELRAKAAAYMDMAIEGYKAAIERQQLLEKNMKKAGDVVLGGNHSATSGEEYLDRNGTWRYTQKGADTFNAIFNNDKQVQRLTKKSEDYIKKQVELEQEAADLIAGLGLSIVETTEKTNDERLKLEKLYLEELRKAEDLEYANKEDTIENRIERINVVYQRKIDDTEALRDNALTDELKALYTRQIEAIMKAREKAIETEYAKEADAHRELIAEILGDYMTYNAKREAITKKYQDDIETMRKEADTLPENSKERLALEEAIAEAERQQGEELLNLDVEYGHLNELIAKREELEKKILVTTDKIADAQSDAERDALVAEMKRLREELKKVNKEIEEMSEGLEESGDAVEGFLSSSNYGQVIEAVGKLIESLELCGVTSKDTSSQISDMFSLAQSAVKGYMSGGAFGMFLSLLNTGLDIANRAAAEAQKAKKIMNDMIILFEQLNLQLYSHNTIFGDDPLGVIIGWEGAVNQYKDLLYKMSDLLQDMGFTETWNNRPDISLGGHDLQMLAQRWGTWFATAGQYEGTYYYNPEFLKQVLEQYGDDLSEEERVFLEHLINYSEQYKDDMEAIASYLTSLFGDVADTIADQMIDSFMETGEAAIDMGAIMSDVAKKMAKDFIKNLLFKEVLLGYQDWAEDIIKSDLSPEDRAAAFYDMLLHMADQINNDVLPDAQAFLEAWSAVFGDTVQDDLAMTGNLLQTATQDSVSLLNGQLNAMRAYQGRMEGMMAQVLLSLANINQDMNDGFSQSISHLRDISYNTSEHGTILRAFGVG